MSQESKLPSDSATTVEHSSRRHDPTRPLVLSTALRRQIVQHLAHRIVNRLLHEPTVRLKEQAADGNGYEYAHMVRELFALQVEDAEAVAEAHRSHAERMVVGD